MDTRGVDGTRPTPITPSVEEFYIDSVDSVFSRQACYGSTRFRGNRYISRTGSKSGEVAVPPDAARQGPPSDKILGGGV
jgi:hypothetical protein